MVSHVGDEPDRPIEFAEAVFIDAVPLQEMVTKDGGRPDAELGTPFRMVSLSW